MAERRIRLSGMTKFVIPAGKNRSSDAVFGLHDNLRWRIGVKTLSLHVA